MILRLGAAALALALDLGLAAAAAQAQEITRCPASLPAVVEEKRAAIVAAAQARDFQALQKLIPAADFTYSFGESEDAIAYWRAAGREHIDIPKLMAAIFQMRCAYAKGGGEGNFYTWPSAAEIEWAKLDVRDRAALEGLYGRKIDQYWIEGRARGYYVGWRGSIDDQGVWRSFVAGD